MKKAILSLIIALVCCGIGTAQVPAISAMVTITISHDQDVNTDVLTLVEMPTATLAQMKLYSSNKFMNSGLPQNLNVYALNDSVHQGRLSTLATTNLDGQHLGLAANQVATNYTFTFSNVTMEAGSELYLYDMQKGTKQMIAENGTYSFEVALADTVETRFMLARALIPDEGELEICHQYGQLTINNNPYTTNIVVKDEEGQVVLDKIAMPTPQVINLASLTKNKMYQVVIGDKTMIIKVQ